MKSCKRWYEEKKCYWKCCLWLCNSHRQHIKAHPTSWHYPLIIYLVCSSAIVMLSQSSLELRSLLDPLESGVALKVNIFQNHLFLYQITHNMTKDCSLNYQCMKTHSVLEWIWIKGSYLSQWLPQGERGPLKESKSQWIEIFHGGSH